MAPPVKRVDLCLASARETLHRFAAEQGPLRTPVPIDRLASWLGYQVVRLYDVPEEFSALVSPTHKLIGINGHHHRHRQRFSVAHEISHILLKHPPEARCTSREIGLYNAEADECAAALLIPGDLLQKHLPRSRRTATLARIFDVSEEAMARKLSSTDALAEPPFSAPSEKQSK